MAENTENKEVSPPEEIEVAHGNQEDEAEDTTETPPELTEEELKAQRRARYKKIAFAVILVAFIAYVIADSLTTGYVKDGVNQFLEWIEANPIPGLFAFMLVYFVATIFFIPGSILTLGAGFVFANAFGLGLGLLLGTLSVFFGASAGAIAAFLIGRYLLRGWVGNMSQKYAIFQALDAAFEEKGLRIMILLRLSPVIPFNAINYIAGVTAIKFWYYVIACFAMLPGTILYVFLGASAGSLADSANSGADPTITIVVIVVGIVFGFAAVCATSYYAKKELNKITEKRREDQEAAENADEANADEENGNSIIKEEEDTDKGDVGTDDQ